MRLRTADGIGAGTNAKIYINFKIMLFLDIFFFPSPFPNTYSFIILSYKTTIIKKFIPAHFRSFFCVFRPVRRPKTSLPEVATSPGEPYGVSRTQISDFFDVRKRPRFSAVRASRGRNSGLMRLQRGPYGIATGAPLQPREGLTARLFRLRRKTTGTRLFVNN